MQKKRRWKKDKEGEDSWREKKEERGIQAAREQKNRTRKREDVNDKDRPKKEQRERGKRGGGWKKEGGRGQNRATYQQVHE